MGRWGFSDALAFAVAMTVRDMSRENEIASGSTYLALYAFALVIERQGRVTKEQSKIIRIYFNNMSFPFSESAYLSAARTGGEVGNFRNVISISKSYAGGF